MILATKFFPPKIHENVSEFMKKKSDSVKRRRFVTESQKLRMRTEGKTNENGEMKLEENISCKCRGGKLFSIEVL